MSGREEAISIPITVFESAESKEDIEDWLLSRQPSFIRAMRDARRDDLGGQCRSLAEVRKRLATRSS